MTLIDEIRLIISHKNHITKAHFIAVYKEIYINDKDESELAYDVLCDMPYRTNNISDTQELLLIPKITNVVLKIMESRHIHPKNIKPIQLADTEYKKVYALVDSEIKEYEFDILNPIDMLQYAELVKECQLHKNGEIKCILPQYYEIYAAKNGKPLKIYAGDFFDTHDKFWSNEKSNVYVCTQKETFHKITYIKGQGYFDNDKLNINNKDSFNSYALTLNEYTYMGNIYVEEHLKLLL